MRICNSLSELFETSERRDIEEERRFAEALKRLEQILEVNDKRSQERQNEEENK